MLNDQAALVSAMNDVGLWILISTILPFIVGLAAVIFETWKRGPDEFAPRRDGHANAWAARKESEEYCARMEAAYAARKAERAARRA